MVKLLAKNYATRGELETDIEKRFGRTAEPKIHTLTGTREELERLGLSDRRRVWGISCVIEDTPTETRNQQSKADRGEVFKHGLNLEN